MKIKTFELPFIGYDYGSEHGWNYDVLINTYGNPVIGIRIKNIVEQYSADPNQYIQFHTVLNQMISIIGENHIVQKLDIFTKKKYVAEKEKQFLQQKYSEHFNGRLYKTIDTVILFSNLIDKKKKKFKFSEKDYKELREKCEKVFMLLEQNQCSPEFLFEKDFEYYISGILSMKFSKVPTFNNIKSTNEYLRIGTSYVKTISYVDIENIDLPGEMEIYTEARTSVGGSDLAIDNFSFLNELEDYQTIIYNQIISIPNQIQRQRDLEKKRKKHDGVAKSAPSNAIVSEEIEDLLHSIAVDGQLIVDAHFSLLFATETLDQMEKMQSVIESKLFTKGIIISKNAYNQLELFRSAIIGNAVELKDYDLFTTTSQAALCFFFKESYPIDEKSNFYLRFADRQGVPLKVDTSDLPYQTGRINNRNKFVLGPSGSGKSFLMNNIVEQYLTYNYDVVIVDTGDSYSGTCAYKGGKYIQYTEEKPITMNPFSVGKEEFNIEKTEFLTNLIFLIWKGAESVMNPTEKSVLDNLLLSYYHQFFEGGTNWYETKSLDDLVLFLNKFNIYKEELEQEEQTLYDVLGLPFDSTNEQIKKRGKELIKQYHPDSNTNNPNYNQNYFLRIFEAYETLSDENKRRVYNETTALIISKTEVSVLEQEDYNINERFKKQVIKRIHQIDKDFQVKELSFNSFYEFCEKFLPIYLNNKHHRITENEFNVRTFLFVLKDFYKGGRYGTTLNESADSSLFYEPFIVFEIDNVKENPKLFPIVTLIIMDTFIQKMRLRSDRRKALIIEEAWKAIASKLMGGYILYLYKTVRKFWGEAVVVTQELDDIIGNAVVKDSIINNSDTFILLDQAKFKDNFDRIASLLSLNKVEQNKIFTINKLNNKFGRGRFKEFYLKRGSFGEVYGNEVSLEQYLTYTTEKPEKSAVIHYVNVLESYDKALESFVSDFKNFKEDMKTMISLVNFYKKPLDNEVMSFYKKFKAKNVGKNVLKELEDYINEKQQSLENIIKYKEYA